MVSKPLVSLNDEPAEDDNTGDNEIVMGFLENRQLEVHFKGVQLGRKKLPGDGPQGTVLGMFCF